MAAAIDNEKYKSGNIHKTAPPIFIKLVTNCWSLKPLSSEMKDNLSEQIPLTYMGVAAIFVM